VEFRAADYRNETGRRRGLSGLGRGGRLFPEEGFTLPLRGMLDIRPQKGAFHEKMPCSQAEITTASPLVHRQYSLVMDRASGTGPTTSKEIRAEPTADNSEPGSE
jgi:hypothetical protein